MNAEEAAKLLGISDKTVRRHIKKGTITATRKASGELKISDDQVEKLRRVLELEGESDHVQAVPPDMSRQLEALTSQLTTMTQQIHDLEQRVSQLEANATAPTSIEHVRLVYPEQSKPMVEPLPTKEARNRNVAPQNAIPDDWMLCSDFFESYGIKETTFRRWLSNGIAGEYFEFEEVPIAGTSKKYRYFTQEQKEAAIEVLRRHGKLE